MVHTYLFEGCCSWPIGCCPLLLPSLQLLSILTSTTDPPRSAAEFYLLPGLRLGSCQYVFFLSEKCQKPPAPLCNAWFAIDMAAGGLVAVLFFCLFVHLALLRRMNLELTFSYSSQVIAMPKVIFC